MSRALRGKPCAYCRDRIATTDDHVFARGFFLVRDRENLPKAPACSICNHRKSKLEQYLTTVLPFAGRHSQAIENLYLAGSRLKKNRRIHREIVRSSRYAWTRDQGGLFERTRMFNFDTDQLRELLNYIARGLAWWHWRVYLRSSDSVSVLLPEEHGSALFASFISEMRAAQRIVQDLGSGTIDYVGVQAPDPPELTVWAVRFYGGALLTEDVDVEGFLRGGSMCWVITGPAEVHDISFRVPRCPSLGLDGPS